MPSASPNTKTLLAIETSCDECSAAVVRAEAAGDTPELEVLSVATFSQIAIHRPYGGVVPELASRNHLETVNPMIDHALADAGIKAKDLDAVAVTNRPGLVGALLVGVTAGKSFAYAQNLPLVAVHHLEGHAASVYLSPQADDIQYPLLLAVVSGGHTNLHVIPGPPLTWEPDVLKSSLVGRSRDDAAGEAFDKTAKLMGFPYPGGKWIDKGSEGGDPKAFALPRALPQKAILDYSFSGLKTAVALVVRDLESKGQLQARKADLCASIQEAILDALLSKIFLAVERHGCKSLAFVGGVAANRSLRAKLAAKCPVPAFSPPLQYCTDNAAMIGAAGAFRFLQGRALSRHDALTLNAIASAEI